MKIRLAMKFCISKLIIAVSIACTGCINSVDDLDERARREATAEEWRAWASQVIERNKTNSTPYLRAEWPDFVRHTAANDQLAWQVQISHINDDTNQPELVFLVALGGFESIGLVIGPPSYVDIAPPHGAPLISRQVYPGIYVRHLH